MSEKQKRKEKVKRQKRLIPALLTSFIIIILVMFICGFMLNQYISYLEVQEETKTWPTTSSWLAQQANTSTVQAQTYIVATQTAEPVSTLNQ